MSNVTDLRDLGTEFMVLDADENPIKPIRIIWHDEIIAAAMGEYNEKFYNGYTDYLSSSLQKLKGFNNEPLNVSWYAETEYVFDLHDAVETAFIENNDLVIVEIICENNDNNVDSE